MAIPLSTYTRPCPNPSCGGQRLLYGQGIEHTGERLSVTAEEARRLMMTSAAVWVCLRCDSGIGLDGDRRGGLSAMHTAGGCDCRERQELERAAAERRKWDA